jgi:hypothetical protein
MQFTERPNLLSEQPGGIARNPVRCNSFELNAGNVTV